MIQVNSPFYFERHQSLQSHQLHKSVEKMASGLRINKSADDSAGLSISTNMNTHIKNSETIKRGIGQGIDYIQVAMGALTEMTDMVQRMRELSLQAMNGTYNDEQRVHIDAEYQQLVKELDHIAQTTEYNGAFPFVQTSLNDVPLYPEIPGLVGVSGYPRFNIEWNEDVDLDPVITDPNGDSMGYNTNILGNQVDLNGVSSTTSSGGVWDVDDTGNPGPNQENFAWPSIEGPAGTYELRIRGYDGPYAFDVSTTVRFIGGIYSSTQIITIPAGTKDIGPFSFNFVPNIIETTNTISGIDETHPETLSIPATTEAIHKENKVLISKTPASAAVFGLNIDNVSSSANAEKSLSTIDSTLEIINAYQAYYGAKHNSLIVAFDQASTAEVNLKGSNSQILDADMASSMSNLLKTQIQGDAIKSMQSISIQSNEEVLRLLAFNQ